MKIRRFLERTMLSELKGRIRGEVLLDPVSREAYSLAECIYRRMPMAVVRPAVEEDVLEVLRFARAEGIPITARGAGTAVAGQSVGEGIVLDCSRHLTRILEINREERWARVEPGVVAGDLDNALRPLGLRFLPDPASADRCTIGGMIANNSGGPRSVRYGDTRRQVIGLTVALADAEVLATRAFPRTALAEPDGGDRQRELARELLGLVEPSRDRLLQTSPRVRRNASGYALLDAVDGERVDLAPLLVGSEGTLAITLEATLALHLRPAATATALVHLGDLGSLGEAVLVALEHAPSAVEALDRSFLDLVRGVGTPEIAALPQETEAVLIVEFEGENLSEAAGRLADLARALVGSGRADGVIPGLDPGTRDRLWDIRKLASPILAARRDSLRSTRFIEDACVPPARLPDLLRELRALLREFDLPAAIFGHAGDAILHLNPRLDPRNPRLGETMERVAAEHAGRVAALGGSLSGEHGDGRLRTGLLPRMFGDTVELFRRVKERFDPAGILNPGIKVPAGASRLSDGIDLSIRPSARAAGAA